MPILTSEERVGTLLAEKYRLESILGRGGMATVFGGRHEWTGRRVAVKVLNHEFSSDPVMAERFLREARTSAGLKHPNVVDVLDMGKAEDGAVYLVLERLDGSDLCDIVASGSLAPDTTFTLLAPVMRALAYAHRKGVVHRDLKPENIFIHEDAEGQAVPKVLDFGIAKILDDAGTSMTKTGMLLGTPDYMSPEQARALPDIGPPTDVWSMGVVWWQCLSGQLPFREPTPSALVITIATTRAPSIASVVPDLHPALVAAIDRALESDRNTRYPDMRAFLDAMVRAAADAGIPLSERDSIDASRLAHIPRSTDTIGDAPTSISEPMSSMTRLHTNDEPLPLVPRPSIADPRTRTKMSWAGSRKVSVSEPRTKRTGLLVVGGVVAVAALTVGGLALFHRSGSAPAAAQATAPTAPTHAATASPPVEAAPQVAPAPPVAIAPAPPAAVVSPAAAPAPAAPTANAPAAPSGTANPHTRAAAPSVAAAPSNGPLVVVPLAPAAPASPAPVVAAPVAPVAPVVAPPTPAPAPVEHTARHPANSNSQSNPSRTNAPLTDYE